MKSGDRVIVGGNLRLYGRSGLEGRVGEIVDHHEDDCMPDVLPVLIDDRTYFIKKDLLAFAPEDEAYPERHPNSQRFHELLKEAGALHDSKSVDYGKDDDPFANVKASQEWGIDGWVGAMVRLTDKVRRLQSLAGKGHLVNEAAIDSFMDIAVYALIARVLYEEDEA